MKWIPFLPVVLLLASCGFYSTTTSTEVVEYREVIVAPPYESVSIVDEEPVDVTTTTVQYY